MLRPLVSKSLPLQQLLAGQLQRPVPHVVECKGHGDAGDVAWHNAASSCRSSAGVSNTARSSKTQPFTQLLSELSILTVLGKEEKDFTGLFDLIKYLENTTADLDVFQTELTMAAYRAVMLQLACVS